MDRYGLPGLARGPLLPQPRPWRRPGRPRAAGGVRTNDSHHKRQGNADVPFHGGEGHGAHRARPMAWRCSSGRSDNSPCGEAKEGVQDQQRQRNSGEERQELGGRRCRCKLTEDGSEAPTSAQKMEEGGE
jgi:hypothetical protein